jgi:SPFH domain/Band 7 family protein
LVSLALLEYYILFFVIVKLIRHADDSVMINEVETAEEELNRQPGRADAWLKQRLPMILLIAIAALVVLWFVSGIYIVNPGHIGVVRTFGKETTRIEPGLHYRLPWPFQSIDIVSIEQIRRIEVGFRGRERVSEEGLMLTGDENIDDLVFSELRREVASHTFATVIGAPTSSPASGRRKPRVRRASALSADSGSLRRAKAPSWTSL